MKEKSNESIFKFMALKSGRLTRIVGGIALIWWGIVGITGTVGYVVAILGLVPLFAGIVDICVFSSLFGNPFKGSQI